MKLRVLIAFILLSSCIVAQEFKYKDSKVISQWVTQSITSTKTNITQNVEVIHSIIYIGDGEQEGMQFYKYIQEFYDGLGEILYYDYDLLSFNEKLDNNIIIQTYRTTEYNIECKFIKDGLIFQTMKISAIEGRDKHIIKISPHVLIYNSLLREDLQDKEEINNKIENDSLRIL